MEVLKTVFSMSIIGSILFFIFQIIKPLTKKNFSASWHYKVFIIILIFFVLPIGNIINFPMISNGIIPNMSKVEIQEPNDLDIMTKRENVGDIPEVQDTGEIYGEDRHRDEAQYKNSTVTETKTDKYTRKDFNINSYKDILLYTWLIGMIILFLLKIIPYIKFKSAILKSSLEVQDIEILEIFNRCKDELNIGKNINLRNCQCIGSPMLIGIFNPTVLIPNTNEDEKTFKMIFLHELNHYKRKDILVKAFSFIVNVIHWFNPIVYILLKNMDIYCECSIDEKVVNEMEIEDRKYYGETILKLIDNSNDRRYALTTAMSSNGMELKSRLENMLFFKKNSKKRLIISLFAIVVIISSGFTIACTVMSTSARGNAFFVVYIKDDGLYYSYLNGGEEIKIYERYKEKEFGYPIISTTGDYVAYTYDKDLYVFDFENGNSDKLAEKIVSYDWVDKDTIIYSTDEAGFAIYDMKPKGKVQSTQEFIDDYYYKNFKVSKTGTIYVNRISKWTIGNDEFSYNAGIVEIRPRKDGEFTIDTIIEGRKSTDQMLGYDPRIWDITDDGKYIYIMEKSASGSLSTDGIGLGIYDVKNKIYKDFKDITVLPYKDHLTINPKSNKLIGLIEGSAREMILNKEVVLLDIDKNNVYNKIDFMDKDLVAMTPNFTLDGEKLLYSATQAVDTSKDFDYNEEFIKWENKPHNIYEYDLKTSKVKKITDGEHFDFMPISISEDSILFIRYRGDGYYNLIILDNGKEEILADNIILDYYNEGRASGFYGHIKVEETMDIFLGKGEGHFKSNENNKYTSNKDISNKYTSNIKSIEVIFNDNNHYLNNENPISIKDKKMINAIVDMLEESQPIQDKEKMSKIRDMAYKDNKLILTDIDNEKKEIKFTFDTLYNIGFIEINGGKLEPKYDFFRYILDLIEYGKYETDIDTEVVKLFEKYNWTVDYRINTINEKLPSDLKHEVGEHPTKLYWAYNNELSKSVGLDFSKYLGNNIVAEIYRLREPLPEYMEPRLNARGIILKKDGKIIGAYIDAGRHESFTCSLDRKDLEDIVNKDWDEWVQDYIDYDNKLEKELAKLSPEEIIKIYFEALDSHDVKRAKACLARTKSNIGLDLSANMSNRELYNKKADDYFDNIKSVKLLKIEKLDEKNPNPEILRYRASADYKFKKAITHEDGILPYTVFMKKESEKSGWKIEDIGF